MSQEQIDIDNIKRKLVLNAREHVFNSSKATYGERFTLAKRGNTKKGGKLTCLYTLESLAS